MRLLRRHPILTALGTVVVLTWVGLATLYYAAGSEYRAGLDTSPTFLLAVVAAGISLGLGLATVLVIAVIPSLRPHLPIALGLLLAVLGFLTVVVGLGGIVAPLMANSGCGCEPS
jgi:hypothetical protein